MKNSVVVTHRQSRVARERLRLFDLRSGRLVRWFNSVVENLAMVSLSIKRGGMRARHRNLNAAFGKFAQVTQARLQAELERLDGARREVSWQPCHRSGLLKKRGFSALYKAMRGLPRVSSDSNQTGAVRCETYILIGQCRLPRLPRRGCDYAGKFPRQNPWV